METRSQQVRRSTRRVFLWSMGLAAAVHVGLFAFSPDFSPRPSDWTSSPLWEEGEAVPGSMLIDVTFGPPTLRLQDGEERQEPPDRFLEERDVAVRSIPIHSDCDWRREVGLERITGAVRLVVGRDGRVSEAAIEDSFGDRCVDHALVAVAGRLWYHWLPNEDAPAPVHVVQPMTVEPAM